MELRAGTLSRKKHEQEGSDGGRAGRRRISMAHSQVLNTGSRLVFVASSAAVFFMFQPGCCYCTIEGMIYSASLRLWYTNR